MRVVLVDDHTLFRQGLRTLLENQGACEIVGEAEDGRQAVSLVMETRPDVVVMDIAMKGLNGLEATRQIRRRFPETKVIVLSMHMVESYVQHALEAGASAYLLKSAAGSELLAAIESVASGGSYFSGPISRLIVEGYLEHVRATSDKRARLAMLTSREKEVLQLISEGHSYKEIASTLKISPKTVGQHRDRLMQKLGYRRTADLVRFALEQGVTPQSS